MGKTIQVFGFPAGVTAEAVKDFLESKTGGGTVYALKLRTPKKGVGRLYAIVQFTTKEAADTIISLACRTEKLWYGRSYLNARRMEQDTVPRPRTFMHTMEHIELHFGCKIDPASDNNVKAAPAANTPLRRVAQDKSPPPKIFRYLVWYAFLAEPANKHASAPKKLTLISFQFLLVRIYTKISPNI